MVDDFPGDVRHFITQNIKSVAELELLLLLRCQGEKTWTAAEICRALYTSEAMSSALLAELHSRGLIKCAAGDSQFSHGANSPELDALVGRLCDLYAERRVAVIAAIYAEPIDKVQSFADAFKLRKEK